MVSKNYSYLFVQLYGFSYSHLIWIYWFSNKSILPRNGAFTTPDQSGPGSNGNEEMIPHSLMLQNGRLTTRYSLISNLGTPFCGEVILSLYKRCCPCILGFTNSFLALGYEYQIKMKVSQQKIGTY